MTSVTKRETHLLRSTGLLWVCGWVGAIRQGSTLVMAQKNRFSKQSSSVFCVGGWLVCLSGFIGLSSTFLSNSESADMLCE